ncbi:hypothetical protein GCM10010324_01540 [Streptomyces hiroshimensis]|uniref:Uncharacterized protein n=1 Tax=Streptomyces hiroshimensis TaxID=66424 RepID=A0ABQ2Y543_9ACTN|nr:hypothetical protein GCM10010324_01540 [Streptomyces hiroshimensis]
MSTNYYGVLDTVRFTGELPEATLNQREFGALGVMMLDMLISNAHPILSQSQAFDNSALLAQLAACDKQSDALRKLFWDGRILVKFHPPSLRTPAPGNERCTILNAFCSTIDKPYSILSAWPEITNNYELRRHIIDCLDGHQEGILNIGDTSLENRLEGLCELDRVVQHQPLQITEPVAWSLYDRVRDRLFSLIGQEEATDALIDCLLNRSTSMENSNRDQRAAWYRLVRDYESGHPDTDSYRASRNATDVIDGVYNSRVAESLRASGVFLNCADRGVAQDIADSLPYNSSVGASFVSLSADRRLSDWLTWSYLSDTLPHLDVMSPSRRMHRALDEHKNCIGLSTVDGKIFLCINANLHALSVRSGAAVSAGAMGALVASTIGPLGSAIASGALATLLGQMAELPLIKRRHEARQKRLIAKAGERWRETVRGGSASLAEEDT